MSDDIKQEDIIENEGSPSESEEQKKLGDANEAKGLNRDGTPKEQDPLKPELEKVQKKEKRFTKKQTLIYNRNRLNKEIDELGGDDEEGDESDDDQGDDNQPVTKRMLKEMQKKNATKTALELAEEIENESERELTKYHIKNSIKPTGDPKQDLTLARAIVNNTKNQNILEELQRKNPPKKHSSAGGAPQKQVQEEEELTADEIAFMKPPFNLSKDQVLKAREGK